jgi:pSer/pThr/pTyr-binding forkhead associated (FHA) protein
MINVVSFAEVGKPDFIGVALRLTRHRFGRLFPQPFLVGEDDAGPLLERLDGWSGGPRALFVVGRGDDCDVRLASNMVSRHHARLLVEKERVLLLDLSSRHGTCAEGNLLAPGEEREIALGARILFADVVLTLMDPHAAWDWVHR